MILAISHHAGGTGKTHLTINLGYQLARFGHRVLLVDLDPQADLSRRLGLRPVSPTLAETMADGKGDPVPLLCAWYDVSLWVLPASLEMAGVEPRISGRAGAEQRLRRVLQNVTYDFILIDCAPSLSLLTMNAWYAADGLLVPVHAEDKAYNALDLLFTTLQEINAYRPHPLAVFGIVATKVDSRENMGPEVVKALHQHYPQTFLTSIPLRTEAKYEGRYQAPVSHTSPTGDVAHAYSQLAEEVATHAFASFA